ncbi:MAG: PH domain-containing protein [Acidimicrobiia bacterium]
MGWPEDSLSEGEIVETEFRQHWKLLIVPIAWFVLALIIIGVIAWIVPDGDAWDWVQLALTLAVVGAAIWFVVRPIVSWLTTRYVLTNERLVTRRGLIAKAGIEIPLENITNVNFSQTAIERMLGAGDLLVESAGTTGQSEFKNIPRPDTFASLLYKVREERAVSMQGGTVIQAKDSDPTEQLQRLKKLHEDGILTDEEYQAKRQKLVDEI